MDWAIDDGTVTVHIEGQRFWLPSREPAPGPVEMRVDGVLTGPGNRGEISLWPTPELLLFTILGTIIIG